MRKSVSVGWGKSPKAHHLKEVKKLSHKTAIKKSKTGLKSYFKAKGGTVIGDVSGANVKGFSNGG